MAAAHGRAGGPALGATAGFEEEEAALHFCLALLSTESEVYQGLPRKESSDNTATVAKSLTLVFFSCGIAIVSSLNHCKSGAAESHTNLFN